MDTNVFVRLFVDDDHRQHRLATRFFLGRSPDDMVFVSVITVVEFFWVMTRTYKRPVVDVLNLLSDVIVSEDAEFEASDIVRGAIQTSLQTGADLSDLLISKIGELAGCSHTVTFDHPAARAVPGMELLK